MGRYAGVRPRGRGYEATWRDATGAQRSRGGFAREKDAHDFRVEQLAAIGKGLYVDPRAGQMTVGEQYALWQQNRRVSQGRRAVEASHAKNHLLPRWGAVRLDAVDADSAQAWVNDLSERLAPRTVIECYRLLLQTMKAATRAKRRADNPVDHVKPPKLPTRRLTHDDVLDADELRAVLLAVPQDRWRALVLLVGWMGPRLGEALGVRRCDINPLLGTITFGRVVIEEVQGNPHPRSGGKNENAERVVPLPPSVAAALNAHMEAFVTDPSPEAFLFLQDNGRHPSRGNLLRHTLKPAVAIAGISASTTLRPDRGRWLVDWYDTTGRRCRAAFPDREKAEQHAATTGGGRTITFRQLRHSAASIMFDLGVDDLAVSQWLGHYKPSFTLDFYTHLLKRSSEQGTLVIEQAMLAGAR